MKLILALSFYFINVCCFSQTKKEKFIRNNYNDTFTVEANFSINHDGLNLIYNEIQNFNGIKGLTPLRIFSFSSTIFDHTKIILIDSTRFFACRLSCMQRFCTAGYYNRSNSIYVFSSDKKVLDSLKENIDEYYSSLGFADFKRKVFIETNGIFSFVQ